MKIPPAREQIEKISAVPRWVHTTVKLAIGAVSDFSKKNGQLMAAGLAYYMMFSVSPVLVIAMAVTSAVIGRETAHRVLLERTGELLGADAAEAVSNMTRDIDVLAGGLTASLLAGIVLLWGATRVFAALQGSLDTIWEVPQSTSIAMGVLQILRSRLVAFLMVLSLGLVLLATMMLETVGSTVETLITRYTPFDPHLGTIGERVAAGLVRALCLAAIYRGLPACKIAWRHVWLAGVITTLMLSFGHSLIGWYIRTSGMQSAYGAASSVIALLFSFYYAAFVFLCGAQFSKTIATRTRGLAA